MRRAKETLIELAGFATLLYGLSFLWRPLVLILGGLVLIAYSNVGRRH